MTLEEFKRVLREQFFALLLDRNEALAAIPSMLPADPAVRAEAIKRIRQVVLAVGEPAGERAERLAEIGERAERLAEIERLFLGEAD